MDSYKPQTLKSQSEINKFIKENRSFFKPSGLDVSTFKSSEEIKIYINTLSEICNFFNTFIKKHSQNFTDYIIYIHNIIQRFKLEDHILTMTFDTDFFKPNLIQIFNESIVHNDLQIELLHSLDDKTAKIIYEFLSLVTINYKFTNQFLIYLFNNQTSLNINLDALPIITANETGLLIDQNQIIRNWKSSNLYLNLQSNPQSIINNLNARIIQILEESYEYKQKPDISEPENVIKDLIKIDRNLIEHILLESQEEFRNIRQPIVNSLNEVLNNNFLSLDLINEILKDLRFKNEHKTLILEFCEKPKVLQYRERIKKILFCLLNKKTHKFLKKFLEIQTLSNRGAQRFSKICELLCNISNTNLLINEYQEKKFAKKLTQFTDPREFLKFLETTSLTHLLKTHELDGFINHLSQEAKDKLSQVLIKLTYFESIIEKEQLRYEIRSLIGYSIENLEKDCKLCSSSSTENLEIETIEQFLENTTLQTETGVCTETTDLHSVLTMGVVPKITCFSYINGFHKREVLGFAMLDDRKLVQYIEGQTIHSRASFKILAPVNLDTSKHAIFLDNIYGRSKDIHYFIELAYYKSKELGLELCIPIKHEQSETQKALNSALSMFSEYQLTDEYNQYSTNVLSMNYSDTISSQMVRITGELTLPSSSSFISTRSTT